MLFATSAADAPGYWPFVIGFANSFENNEEDPKKLGMRKSNVDQISKTLFCTGVPVKISLCLDLTRREALAVTIKKFQGKSWDKKILKAVP
jgi:hypothetical protein